MRNEIIIEKMIRYTNKIIRYLEKRQTIPIIWNTLKNNQLYFVVFLLNRKFKHLN